jgi:DNA repair ATPase RecN
MGPKTDMLTALTVRQLAVVEDLSLTFKSGMTSLTGETGAGKSILVDALGWFSVIGRIPIWFGTAVNVLK